VCESTAGSNPALSAIHSATGRASPALPVFAHSLTHLQVRSLACSPAPCLTRPEGEWVASWRGRLVDYGAALEMRFGATRRGFESRPLRQPSGPSRRRAPMSPFSCHVHMRPARHIISLRLHGLHAPRSRMYRNRPNRPGQSPLTRKARRMCSPGENAGYATAQADGYDRPARELPVNLSLLSFPSRARRGTSGALNLQSAPAGLNSHPRSPYSNATVSSDVEDRVPRSGDSRTVSDPEGSSTKRSSSGAAERPGPSRSFRRARDRGGRRWVHGISSSPTPGS
jgi:hypothetical protein